MTGADTIQDVDVMRCPECGARFGVDAAFCPFDGLPLASGTWDKALDPLRGRVIDDRYEVLELLGEGGMGSVYRVRHVTLDRHFALKILRRELAADSELASRFVREAKATAAVRHPSVVAITDFGELDGVPYFVMELLIGETLATRLRGRGPMEPASVIRIGRLVAEALEASHRANVVHRDLKPENVFLVGVAAGAGHPMGGEIRIVDFGAAKIVGASKLTRPGIVFGTPYYMSPEQANGQQVDGRSDVYSLGVLLYEMVTGVLPFEADTYMGVLTKHIYETPERPSARLPSGVVLGELEQVILTALAKEPSARFATMGAIARALADLEARHASPPAPTASLPRSTVPLPGGLVAPKMSTADRIERAVERRLEEETSHRRKRVALFGGLSIVALVAAVMASRLLFGEHALREGAEAGPERSLSLVAPASAAIEQGSPSTSAAAPSSPSSPSPASSANATGAAPSSSTEVSPPSSARAEVKPRSQADPSRNVPPSTAATRPPRPPPEATSERGALNPENFKDPWAR